MNNEISELKPIYAKIDELLEDGRINEKKADQLKTAYTVKYKLLERDWYNQTGKREPVKGMYLNRMAEGEYRERDLSELDLEGIVFNDSFINDTNFENSNLKNIVFKESKVIGNNFRNADMQGASFLHTLSVYNDYTNANLSSSYIINSSMYGEKSLDSTNLDDAYIEESKICGNPDDENIISELTMKGARIARSILRDLQLYMPNMKDVSIDERSILHNLLIYGTAEKPANLDNMWINKSCISKCKIKNASIKNMEVIYYTRFLRTIIEDSDLSGSKMEELRMKKTHIVTSKMDDMEFVYPLIIDSALKNITLNNTTFKYGSIEKTRFFKLKDTEDLTFDNMHIEKSFIELKGQISIDFKGTDIIKSKIEEFVPERMIALLAYSRNYCPKTNKNSINLFDTISLHHSIEEYAQFADYFESFDELKEHAPLKRKSITLRFLPVTSVKNSSIEFYEDSTDIHLYALVSFFKDTQITTKKGVSKKRIESDKKIRLLNPKFIKSDITRLYLRNAYLIEPDFYESEINSLDLKNSELVNPNFEDAKIIKDINTENTFIYTPKPLRVDNIKRKMEKRRKKW